MANKILFLILFVSSTNAYSDSTKTDSLIKLLPTYNDSKEKVILLIRIAEELTNKNPDKSTYYTSEALSLAKKIKYHKGYSFALRNNASKYDRTSDYTSAMEVYLTKLRLDDSIGNKIGLAYTFYGIGNIFYIMKEYKKSLDYFNRSLEIYKELNELKGVSSAYICIGNIYEATNEIDKAEYYYLIGLDILKKNPVKKNTDTSNNSIEALEQQLSSLSVSQYKGNIAISYNNLGYLYFTHNKDTSASKYFIDAIKCLPEVPNKETHVLIYSSYGDYFLWRNQLDSAFYYLKKGLDLAKNYALPLQIKDISSSLSEFYSKKKDFEKAFIFQRISEKLNDSLFSINTSSRLAFLDYQYNQSRIENLRTIEFLKQQKKIKTRLWIFIVITILAGSFTCLFFIYHRYKIKQEKLSKEKLNIETVRLQEQLDFRNKEIVVFTMNLFERNELIRQVIQKLKDIYPLLKVTNKPLVEDVIHDLKGKYHENILNEFEHRFKEVHNNFYKNISKDFPDLTANDLRLCAFLKMNMSTKDIAFLTHQSTNSIEVARTRLRRKLNIHHSDIDLVMFLSNY